jgi:X-X-X-Leu-X-X-Gly heptad repeat protein
VALMLAAPVDLNALPGTNTSRRTFIPLGETSSLTYVKDEFTPAELDVIKKTPFLASRIESTADVGNIIGYRDSYKNDLAKLEARRVYNFALNNPKEFLKSEFPAYLGSGDAMAASRLVEELYKQGETPESIKVLYDASLPLAPEYSLTSSERREINMATESSGGGIQKFFKPIFTTIGAIAGGPIGAAVMNSLLQLGETGKVDPEETAKVAAMAYVGEQLTAPAGTGEAATGAGEAASGAGEAASGAGEAAASTGGSYDISDVGSLGDLEYGLPPINLLDGVTFPSQGLSPPTVNDLIQTPGALTPDVSLISPDAVFPGQGLISPTMPGIAAMGGGQGATVGVPGGTVGQGGFTPTGAVPVLGDPSSFINDPDVLGQPVIEPESSSISLNDAFRAANLAQSLMAGQPQQQYPNQQLSGTQATGVDLLSLPQFVAGVPNIAGLLNPIPYRGLTFDFYTGLPTSLLG